MKRQSLISAILAAATAMTFAACQRESVVGMSGQDRPLSFVPSVSSQNGTLNSTASKSVTIQSADGSISLPLECSVCDGMPGTQFADTATGADSTATKAAQYNTVSELQDNIGTFRVTAWNSDNTKFIPTDESTEGTVNYTSGRWTLVGTAPLWKNADVKTFFAYTNLPAGATVTCSDDASQTFSYATLKTDAADQNDALLGYYQGNGDRDGDGVSDGVARIRFIHPLTAVVFKQGDFEGITDVKSLSIEGVYDGGTAAVTYSYDPDGNLVPHINWGTSRSTTTTVSQTVTGDMPGKGNMLGVPFIILPQDLATQDVTIKAVVTADSGDQEIMAELKTGSWVEGKTNTYTLGYDAHTYTYTFTLEDPSKANLTFNNTTTTSTQDISIINKRLREDGVESAGEYVIKSVKVGTNADQIINATSFSNIGGLSASVTSATTLSITAATRQSANPGSHNYWVNQDDISGDTDGTGWSPKSWGSDGLGKGTIDLSKFNFQTETTNNPMTTANCYIIRHAGTYKLPLVYGNAMVNGDTNEQSYYPNVTGGSNRLERFVNSTDAGIESPFIENAAGCGGSDLKCAVIWQDKAEVVKSLQIVEGASAGTVGSYTKDNVRYLQFSISQSDICQNNALICVYKDKEGGTANQYDSGEAVWSWHIWTTNDPALLTPAIPVTNFTDKEYDFFPLYTLGWIDPESYPSRSDVKIVLQQKKSGNEIEIAVTQPSVAIVASNGCYYQFGRKDPMPTDDVTGFTPNVSGGSTLSNAICNPGKFYNGASYNNWCSTTYDNLWTGKKSANGKFDQAADMIKTIYDPSPVGYKMPASQAFTGFTTTGGNTTNKPQFNVPNPDTYNNDKGYYFYTVNPGTESTPTIFFPAAGARNSSSGSVYDVGSIGHYWSAVPCNSSHGYFLYIDLDHVFPVNDYHRATGFSVRPVQE